MVIVSPNPSFGSRRHQVLTASSLSSSARKSIKPPDLSEDDHKYSRDSVEARDLSAPVGTSFEPDEIAKNEPSLLERVVRQSI